MAAFWGKGLSCFLAPSQLSHSYRCAHPALWSWPPLLGSLGNWSKESSSGDIKWRERWGETITHNKNHDSDSFFYFISFCPFVLLSSYFQSSLEENKERRSKSNGPIFYLLLLAIKLREKRMLGVWFLLISHYRKVSDPGNSSVKSLPTGLKKLLCFHFMSPVFLFFFSKN